MPEERIEEKANIFIARQPIFDNQSHVFAYELLYRSDMENRAFIANDQLATIKVIANSLLIGLQKLTDNKKAFINFDQKLLLAHAPLLFSRDILGVEIVETIQPELYVIRECSRIKRAGYSIVLDNFAYDESLRPFIDMADLIKVNFKTASTLERRNVIERVNAPHIKFIASKIENREEFQEAVAFGYTYFQGFFFRKPSLVSRQEMPGYKANYLNILRKIYDPNFNIEEIESIIKHDVSLAYKLFRFINSASYGFRVEIRSISHALLLLGKREIKRWLTIIVMSGIGKEKPMELMVTAVIRARFLESIAEEFKLEDHPSDLFLIGMFSLVEAFIDLPMSEILAELPLDDHVKTVLMGEDGQSYDILGCVKAFEKGEWETVSSIAQKHKLNEEKLAVLYLDAVEWSKFLSNS